MTCEIDADCRSVYANSLGAGNGFVPNIRELTRNDPEDEEALKSTAEISRTVPDHDLLCAGFPCQPFSKSGRQEGFRDKTRGTLFLDICQILEAKQPKYVFLENVRNIAGPRHKNTWNTIVSSLRSLNYNVHPSPLVFSPHLLAPEFGGTPQVRDRVLILGIRNDCASDPIQTIAKFEELCRKKTLWNPDDWNIRKYLIPDKDIPNLEKYRISEDEQTYVEAWNHLVENFPSDHLPGFPIWTFAFHGDSDVKESMPEWERAILRKNSDFYADNKEFLDKWMKIKWGSKKLTIDEFPFSRKKFEWQARKSYPTRKGRTLKNLVLQFRPSGIRVKPPTYLPALVAITQTSVVGPGLRENGRFFRKLTPVEAGRLQGIPDRVYQGGVVDDKIAYKQLGNAVNAGLIAAISSLLLGGKFSSLANSRMDALFKAAEDAQTRLFQH